LLDGAKKMPVPDGAASTSGSLGSDLRMKKIGELIMMVKAEVGA
jgi:hypothetical protein